MREVEQGLGAPHPVSGSVVSESSFLSRLVGAEPDSGAVLSRVAYLGGVLPPRPLPHSPEVASLAKRAPVETVISGKVALAPFRVDHAAGDLDGVVVRGESVVEGQGVVGGEGGGDGSGGEEGLGLGLGVDGGDDGVERGPAGVEGVVEGVVDEHVIGVVELEREVAPVLLGEERVEPRGAVVGMVSLVIQRGRRKYGLFRYQHGGLAHLFGFLEL